jgi:membrane associated rhomboid family serine protease
VLPNSVDTILNIFVDGHLWRLFTPIFLHFDWFEIIIGLVPFIYLGWQVEMNEGKGFFIVAMLFLSAVSHICHFYLASHLIISGISCINLGLLAYIAISKTYPIAKTYHLASWPILLTSIVLLIDIWQSPYLLTAYIGSTLSGIALVFTQQHLLKIKN